MRLEKCFFCSSNCYPGKGITFVRNDAKVFKFCRSKCHKNFKLKRNPRKISWTKASRKVSGKELSSDSVFEFEKRRNVPTVVTAELMEKTVGAIKKVQQIKSKRELRFYQERMAGKKVLERLESRKKKAVETSGEDFMPVLTKAEIAEKIALARNKKLQAGEQMEVVMN